MLEIKRERKRQADRRHRKGRIVATFFQKECDTGMIRRVYIFHSKAIIKVVDDLVKGMLGAWDGGASEPFLLVFACPSVWIQESHGALKL